MNTLQFYTAFSGESTDTNMYALKASISTGLHSPYISVFVLHNSQYPEPQPNDVMLTDGKREVLQDSALANSFLLMVSSNKKHSGWERTSCRSVIRPLLLGHLSMRA